ncbi:AB hydrolase superfamily protein YdjP [compost metagenome]
MGKRIRQGRLNKVTRASLANMRVPTLLMTGDSDLYFPPSLLRRLTPFFPRSEAAVVPESGHSIYWERPDIFNRIVLDFLRRHAE